MKTLVTLLIFIMIAYLTSLGQGHRECQTAKILRPMVQIDTASIAIIPFNTTQSWIFENSQPINLTNRDIETIEIILRKCINNYNPTQEQEFQSIHNNHPEYNIDKTNFIIDLQRYKRQYIAAINAKREKEVWINCFCKEGDLNWKTNLIIVKDGGDCYFNLKINLTTGKYYELVVNGDS